MEAETEEAVTVAETVADGVEAETVVEAMEAEEKNRLEAQEEAVVAETETVEAVKAAGNSLSKLSVTSFGLRVLKPRLCWTCTPD